MKRKISSFCTFIGISLLIFSTTSFTNSKPDYFVIKNSELPISTPQEQEMNLKDLKDMDEYISSNLPAYRSALVVRGGSLVFEKYYGITNETKNNIFSVTKSVISALIGIAIHKGLIKNVNTPILEFFDDKNITVDHSLKQNITIHHVLTMTMGLEWYELQVGYDDPNNSLYQMWDSEDWVEFVLNLNVVSSPGNEFNYNTGASHLLSAILTKATGMSTLDFAQGNLFNPLGIEPQDWPVDPQGINKGGEGLELSALALAKFGLLYLNNGSWNSAQIVPKDWILKSSKDYHPQRGSAYGYGYQWWIHNDETVYSAWGYAEQRIIIVPKYNVVAVFTAYMRDASGDIAGNIVNTFIIPSIQNFLPFGSTLTTKIFSYNPRVSSSIDFLFFLLSCISLIKFKKKNCKMKK